MSEPKTLGEAVTELREECKKFLSLTDKPEWGLISWTGFLATSMRAIHKLTGDFHPEGKERTA